MSISLRKFVLPLSVLCALAAAGCRSHATAAKPVVEPTKAVAAAPVQQPAVRVESPAREFVPDKVASDDLGNDPAKATLLAEQKGWIRDAFFDFDSSALQPPAQQNLTTSANWLRDHHKFKLLVEGHCDERGTEQYNLALGDRRAWEAKDYLGVLGIDPKTVSTISYGKEKPFDPGHSEDAWAKNRRAHLVLTAAN